MKTTVNRRFPEFRPGWLMGALALVVTVAGTLAVATPTEPDEMKSLRPHMEQRFAVRAATRLLTNWHYRDVDLDDELSGRIFDSYLEMLDPNRSYFLADDVAYLGRYRDGLDEAIGHSELDPAFEIFNLYLERVRQRVAHARGLLEQPFDFSVDETYEFDRSESLWAASEGELNEIWRKRVKNDWLRLKLTDKEPEGIRETLDDRYANLERRISELNETDVFQYFMNAYAQSIEPHTNYLSPRTSDNFEIAMSLSLEGIGALLERQTEYTSIARIVPGGPADMDGRLQTGDRIVGVAQGEGADVVDVIGWRLDDVVELIRGPKDSTVVLEVLPADSGVEGPAQTIDLIRDEVKLEEQAASSEIIEVGEGDRSLRIGVIDLPVFYIDFAGRAENRRDYRSSTRDVRRLINELKQENVDGLIVDLRNNGGGSLLEATTMTGLFIDKGPVVQVRDSNGRISMEEDNEPGMAWDGPLAVMVNRYSASASEIFAAAVQDYGRGLIIGEPTYGKGTVQNLMDLGHLSRDDRRLGQLKLTMAQFFRVNGDSTQNRGVEPDIHFPSAGDPEDFGESALDYALPWTEIDPADYRAEGDALTPLLPTLVQRHESRIQSDQDFSFLLDDIEEYNRMADERTVSVLEATRRAEMERNEARRKARAVARGEDPDAERAADADTDSGLSGRDEVVDNASRPPSDSEADDATEAVAQDEEEYDFLVEEAARIVGDLVSLHRGEALLALEPAPASGPEPTMEPTKTAASTVN